MGFIEAFLGAGDAAIDLSSGAALFSNALLLAIQLVMIPLGAVTTGRSRRKRSGAASQGRRTVLECTADQFSAAASEQSPPAVRPRVALNCAICWSTQTSGKATPS
jgi:hypothetical protein